MYRYETHLHTLPVSKCAKTDTREALEFYKNLGYAGVFLTNHFVDGNINIDKDLPNKTRLEFYYSGYEEAKAIGRELGIAVFNAMEMSYKGTDFLVYGLDKDWFMEREDVRLIKKSQLLQQMREAGALIIQAHPFLEASYIDHIRLYPRHVHGVEVYNACKSDFCNEMAKHYADAYGLLHFAGTDNHKGAAATKLGGMMCQTPVENEQDFVRKVLSGAMTPFRLELDA